MKLFRKLPNHWTQDSRSDLGLVPTMGALHQGHAELIRQAQKTCTEVMVTIFVNPTQFNNPTDLEKYPRVEEQDLALLEELKVDYVWLPKVSEIYPEDYEKIHWDFGTLDKTMEGEHRPGHFNGVAEVVRLLFEKTSPNKAFFGEKDFQQLQIIRAMRDGRNLPIEVVGVSIIREDTGLAFSSRNMRLTPEQKHDARAIYKALRYARESYQAEMPLEQLRKEVWFMLEQARLQPEYVRFARESDLCSCRSFANEESCRLFIAAYAGEVRLIDNMKIF